MLIFNYAMNNNCHVFNKFYHKFIIKMMIKKNSNMFCSCKNQIKWKFSNSYE